MTVGRATGFVLRGDSTPLRELLREMWEARELLVMLARKDFFVRYRRAGLGLLWSIGLPLIQGAVLAVVFTQVVRIEVGASYVVFVMAGIVPWTYFSTSLIAGSTAIVDGAAMASKIYFPRPVLPLVTTAANAYAFVPTVGVLLALMAAFGTPFEPHLALVVPGALLLLLLTSAAVLVASALHVYFRDIRFMVQASVQAWFYATPVIYPLERAPDSVENILAVNPMSGVVQLFRAGVLGPSEVALYPALWFAIGFGVVGLVMGLLLQARFNRVFVDLL